MPGTSRSVFLEADDILSMNIDRMSLEQLVEYAEDLRQIALAFFERALRSSTVSSIAVANMHRIIQKLQWRLDDTLSLIEQRRVEAAEEEERQSDTRTARGQKPLANSPPQPSP